MKSGSSTPLTGTSFIASHPVSTRTQINNAFQQLEFLWQEMSCNKPGLRGVMNFFINWLRGGRVPVAAYRCKRFWWLLLGRWHRLSWLFMWPLYWWCKQVGGRHEIKPEADIGPGLRLIHPSLACVVSPHVVAGKNLYLTGGNVIGRRFANMKSGDIRLGDDVMLGIGSIIIGPLVIGDRVKVGAGATVVKSVPSDTTVVSSPVRYIHAETATNLP